MSLAQRLPVEQLEPADRGLLDLAADYRGRAYTPYSKYQVGAALQTPEGKTYGGCNIENAAYGPTNCAERTAVFKAVSEGDRRFSTIAIAAGGAGFPYPCGVCRQVLSEFAGPDLRVVMANLDTGEAVIATLADLLPFSFTLEKGGL
ncbi:MAG: cytidine deaminase [Bacillota bacterium]